MSDHLRRKVEHWLVAHLCMVPGLVCVPSDGDHGLAPPYAVVSTDEDSVETIQELTSMMTVDVIYATSIHDTPTAAHSEHYRAIQARMQAIRRGDAPELGLIVHGAQAPTGEVSGMSLSGEQAHADAVSIAVGATDLGTPLSGAEIVAGFNGAGRFSGLLGDGAARSFTVVHPLGTGAFSAMILRDAAADGAVHVRGRDYTMTVVDANTVTITLPDALAGLVESVPGLPVPAANGLLLTLLA